MTRPQTIAAVIWVLQLADSVRQGFSLPSGAVVTGLRFDGIGLAITIMPAIFFAVAPLWLRGHPFDVKPIRAWVDNRYGQGTYLSYTRAIRPLALFAASGVVIGLTAMVYARVTLAQESAYVLAAFFLSAGVGFLACRTVLRAQGNPTE